VPKSRFDEVKRALVDAIAAFALGDPADPETAVGPMVSRKPTVFVHVNNDMTIAREEIFGPVLSVMAPEALVSTP
jgi:aldehyde dehydrogenase (NAD+)